MRNRIFFNFILLANIITILDAYEVDHLNKVFSGETQLQYLDLSDAPFENYLFNDGVDLSGTNLRNANLKNAILCEANLTSVDLSFADFRGCNLQGSNLTEIKAYWTKFNDANLVDCCFFKANCHASNFYNAHVCGASFKNAVLDLTNFEQTRRCNNQNNHNIQTILYHLWNFVIDPNDFNLDDFEDFGSNNNTPQEIKNFQDDSLNGPSNIYLKPECSICLEKFLDDEKVAVLPCGHLFHCACINHALTIKNVCPVCKYSQITGYAVKLFSDINKTS